METATQKKRTALEVKVLAVNTLNKYAKEFIKEVTEILQPHIGKDIFKVDGAFGSS